MTDGPGDCSAAIAARFDFLKEVYTAAREALPTLDYVPIKSDAEGFRLQLHLTIIEMTGSCVALFANKMYSAIPILTRVSLEAMADQLSLTRDPTYVQRLVRMSVAESRELPDLMNQHGFEMLPRFLQEPGTQEFLRRLKERSRDLEDNTQEQRLSLQDKFRTAGIEYAYPTHRLLSGEVHNDITALAGRHATKQESGAIRYEIFKLPSDADQCGNLRGITGLLLSSCEAIHRGSPDFSPYSVRFDAMIQEDRARWPNLSNLGHYASKNPAGES